MPVPLAFLLTQFGSFFLLLALALLVAVWLARTPGAGRRAAVVWLGALLLCVGTVALLKIYFIACPLRPLALRSPSGHAGFSCFVYGGVALCLARDETLWRRLLLPLLACAWIAAIAWSRVILHAHSVNETLLGLAIGAFALLVFASASGLRPRRRFPFFRCAAFAAALAVPLLLLHIGFSFEHWLDQLARMLRRTAPICATARTA